MNRVLLSSDKMDWETPQEFFDKYDQQYGFTLDVCALKKTAKCKKYFNPIDNGLKQDWSKDICWMNPPYGRSISQWVKKAYDESKRGATVVCLLPARTDTQYFHEYILPFSGWGSGSADMIWAAGLFDGEGCVFVRKNSPSKNSKQKSIIYDLGIKVSMTSRETVQRFKNIFNLGHIIHEKRGNINWRDAWHYSARSRQAAKILKLIYPYSFTKRHEIFEAINYSLLETARHGRKLVPVEIQNQREYYYNLLRELKKSDTDHPSVITKIEFIKGRLKFSGQKNSAPFPSMIVIFRKNIITS